VDFVGRILRREGRPKGLRYASDEGRPDGLRYASDQGRPGGLRDRPDEGRPEGLRGASDIESRCTEDSDEEKAAHVEVTRTHVPSW
jgi:hypothetical protein